MLNKRASEYMENLQYKVKDLAAQVRAYKSGEQYESLTKFYDKCIASKECEIQKIKRELAEARARYVDVRNNWGEVIEDLESEQIKALAKKDRAIDALWRRIVKLEKENEELRKKSRERIERLYAALTELEEEKAKVQKLKAQINRDYETSGIPSSMSVNKRKITNNREKTGRKPGGQPGHPGHRRRQYEPTARHEIPPAHRGDLNYRPTGRRITKQLIDIKVNLVVTEWQTLEYRDVWTGQRVHADFPNGLVNEVTYGGTVKALAFLVQNHCNVSVGKTSDLLCEITGGQLRLSTGTICNLAKEFSQKTEAERKKAFADMMLAPSMNVDFSTARVNGKNMAVFVCANDEHALYFAKEHKGHEGVKGTPLEDYQNTVTHDHDITFYRYGSRHQECLEHIRRYLKDGIINELNKTWHTKMRRLINEMMAWWGILYDKPNSDSIGEQQAKLASNPDEIDPVKVAEFEARYDEILNLATKEYEDEPPNMKCYPDGFNLLKRMKKYRDNHLLFLHDRSVSPTNNLSERLLRIFKRKQHQVMSFRSFEGLGFVCDALGVIADIRYQGKNLYNSLADIFSPKLPSLSLPQP